jgi:hypothetical protein
VLAAAGAVAVAVLLYLMRARISGALLAAALLGATWLVGAIAW